MKQKVMIICAFLVEPSLYIVDEPFMGLDPLAIQDLIDLMMEMKNGEFDFDEYPYPSDC